MNKSQELKRKILDTFGSATKFAQACGVKPQHVNNWFTRGFPKDVMLIIESESKKRKAKITVYDLLDYDPKEIGE